LRTNCINSMQKIFDYAESTKQDLTKEVMAHRDPIMEAKELTEDIANIIIEVWKDSYLKTFAKEHENSLQIPSSAEYFFENASRFCKENYKPTEEDILRAKLRTTGISETKFTVDKIDFTMVDVGGQRAERRKWLHCFDGITAVIYLAALDEYNMTLQEDNTTNRLEESLKLFGEVTNSQWFGEKSFILFLNKSDLFRKKIKKFPLEERFNDYKAFKENEEKKGDEEKRRPKDMENDSNDDNDKKKKRDKKFEMAVNYISSKYEEVYEAKGRLYVYVTCALDTQNCKKVFEAVRDNVIATSLQYAGFN